MKAYLEGLFEPEEPAKALGKLRNRGPWVLASGCNGTLLPRPMSNISFLASFRRDCLMRTRTTLRAFKENPTILDEVASVLNMRLASLDSWSWPSEGVVVRMVNTSKPFSLHHWTYSDIHTFFTGRSPTQNLLTLCFLASQAQVHPPPFVR